VPAVVEDFPPTRYRLAIDWQRACYFIANPLANLVAIRSPAWCQFDRQFGGGNPLASLVAIRSPA
jgi:hypothetical protein